MRFTSSDMFLINELLINVWVETELSQLGSISCLTLSISNLRMTNIFSHFTNPIVKKTHR